MHFQSFQEKHNDVDLSKDTINIKGSIRGTEVSSSNIPVIVYPAKLYWNTTFIREIMHHIDSECCLPTGEHNHAITVQEKQNKTARIAEALTCHSQCSHHSLSKCCIYLCYLLLNFLSKSNITTLTIVCGYFKMFMIFVLLCSILFFIKW